MRFWPSASTRINATPLVAAASDAHLGDVDAFLCQTIAQPRAEGIAADAPHHSYAAAEAGTGHRLVRAFAARHEGHVPSQQHRFAAPGARGTPHTTSMLRLPTTMSGAAIQRRALRCRNTSSSTAMMITAPVMTRLAGSDRAHLREAGFEHCGRLARRAGC